MEPIKKVQAKEYVADILRKEILLKRLSDGEELAQEFVSKQFGLSRMPVREAFQILETEGFLERLPNRHMVVKGLTAKGIYEVFSFINHIQTGFINEMLNKNEECGRQFLEVYGNYKRKYINETDLHSYFSEGLDNPYIQEIHRKLLKIYVGTALEDLGLSGSEETDIWEEVSEGLLNKDEEILSELFKNYFFYLAKAMTEKVLKE